MQDSAGFVHTAQQHRVTEKAWKIIVLWYLCGHNGSFNSLSITCVFILRSLFTKFTCLHLTGYKNLHLVVYDLLRLLICLINCSTLILVKLHPLPLSVTMATETLKWWLEGALPVSSYINTNKV